MIYAEVQREIKLKFCMCEAVKTVSVLKKSNVYDDVVFLTENSKLLKSMYPLNEGVCRNIWQIKNFAIPGFGDRTFKVNRSVTERILQILLLLDIWTLLQKFCIVIIQSLQATRCTQMLLN